MTSNIQDLKARVEQFSSLELPGQPPMLHMGTSYLVEDLWREVRRLRGEVARAEVDAQECRACIEVLARNLASEVYERRADLFTEWESAEDFSEWNWKSFVTDEYRYLLDD